MGYVPVLSGARVRKAEPETSVTGDMSSDEIVIEVTVTNTDDAAGKDAVQIYAAAPYTKDGIEKA